jgi:hypothetical protein
VTSQERASSEYKCGNSQLQEICLWTGDGFVTIHTMLHRRLAGRAAPLLLTNLNDSASNTCITGSLYFMHLLVAFFSAGELDRGGQCGVQRLKSAPSLDSQLGMHRLKLEQENVNQLHRLSKYQSIVE